MPLRPTLLPPMLSGNMWALPQHWGHPSNQNIEPYLFSLWNSTQRRSYEVPAHAGGDKRRKRQESRPSHLLSRDKYRWEFPVQGGECSGGRGTGPEGSQRRSTRSGDRRLGKASSQRLMFRWLIICSLSHPQNVSSTRAGPSLLVLGCFPNA